MNERINRRDFIKLGVASLAGAAVGFSEVERMTTSLGTEEELALQQVKEFGFYSHRFSISKIPVHFLGVEHTVDSYNKNAVMIQTEISHSDIVITEGRPVDFTLKEKVYGLFDSGFFDLLFEDAIDSKRLVITPDPRFGWEDTLDDVPLGFFWARAASSVLQRKFDFSTLTSLLSLGTLSSYLRYNNQNKFIPQPRLALFPETVENQIVGSGLDDEVIFDSFFHSNIRLARTIRQVAQHPSTSGGNILVIYGFAHLFPTIRMIDDPSLMQLAAGTTWDMIGVKTKAYLPEPQSRNWKEVPYLYGDS